MKIGQQIKFIVINKQANSLYSLIADGQYRNTSLGRDTWKSLIGSNASLQLNCKKEGFNAKCTKSGYSKARIGILGNDQTDCHTCNSRLGFGSGGNFDDRGNTCGNLDNHGRKKLSIKTMGYILVQWEQCSFAYLWASGGNMLNTILLTKTHRYDVEEK